VRGVNLIYVGEPCLDYVQTDFWSKTYKHTIP
jgi:hypothetical protein